MEDAATTKNPAPMAEIDRTLHALGFQYELISPDRLIGRIEISEICCQPFNVMNGGLSALMAESMASLGAYVASCFCRVAGVQLSTNHLRPARLGEIVEGEAKPLHVGRNLQVWKVQLWTVEASTRKAMISETNVTLISNRAAPEAKEYQDTVKKFVAKL